MLPSFADLVQIVLRDVTLLQKKKNGYDDFPLRFLRGGEGMATRALFAEGEG